MEKNLKNKILNNSLFSRHLRQNPQELSMEKRLNIEKPAKQKKILRWILFAGGLGLFIYSIFFFILATNIPWFKINITYENTPRDVNFSPVLGMGIMAISVWLMSRVTLNQNLLRENTTYIPHFSLRREPLEHKSNNNADRDFLKLRSFASSRLIAASLLVIIAVINISKFGLDISGENHVGSWFFLGGPSMFYPMSFLPLGIAIGLILYSIFSSSIITFSRSKNYLFIEEYRFMAPWMTEIPREKIQAIRISNGHTGTKYIWILIMGIPTIWCFVEGFHYLLNPFTFGGGYLVGTMYLLSALVDLVAIIILVVKTQTFLEIVTNNKRYELQFSPPAAMQSTRSAIEEVLGIPIINLSENKEHDSSLTNNLIKDWKILGIGLSFIIIALLSQNTYLFAGEPLRIALYLFGFMLCIKGFKENFSSPRHPLSIIHDSENNNLYLRKQWVWFNSTMKIQNCSSEDYSYEYRLAKLGFFETVLGLIVALIIGMDLAGVFIYVDWVQNTIGIYLIHIIGDFIIFLMILTVIIHPQNTLKIKTASINFEYPIPGTLSSIQSDELKGASWFKKLKTPWSYVANHQSISFWIRIIACFVLFLIGMFETGSTASAIEMELFSSIMIVLLLLALSLYYFSIKKYDRPSK